MNKKEKVILSMLIVLSLILPFCSAAAELHATNNDTDSKSQLYEKMGYDPKIIYNLSAFNKNTDLIKGQAPNIRGGVTYRLSVYISYYKPSHSFYMTLYGSSTASASENIDYIEASGNVWAYDPYGYYGFSYGPNGRYNNNFVVASGSRTRLYVPSQTFYNTGHGYYIIDGISYNLYKTVSVVTKP